MPWGAIDMDFMNLNQSAHGDREFGFICTRLRLNRKVVVGHWQDEEVQERVGAWMRAACGWADDAAAQGRPLRRQHARGGGHRGRQGRGADGSSATRSTATASATWSRCVNEVSEAEIDELLAQYSREPTRSNRRSDGAAGRTCASRRAIELGMRAFLREGGFKRLHHHLRGPARPEPAARPGRAAADGRRLRLRRRRRLEDRRPWCAP